MAVLINADRKAIWKKWMEESSSRQETVALNKNELRSVVDAIDVWINANQASFNIAIPEPGRTTLTAKQKASLLMLIVNKRWEVT